MLNYFHHASGILIRRVAYARSEYGIRLYDGCSDASRTAVNLFAPETTIP